MPHSPTPQFRTYAEMIAEANKARTERDRYHGVLEQAVLELDDWRNKGSAVMRDELVDDFITAAKTALDA